MTNKEIKAQAKKLIKDNLGILLVPTIIINLFNLVFRYIPILYQDTFAMITAFLTLPLSIGTIMYYFEYLKNRDPKIKTIFSAYKKIITIYVVSVLMFGAIFVGSLFLLVPGIIFSLMFSQTSYILADEHYNKIKIIDALKESARLMKNKKANYLGLVLSFFGWFLLAPVTFGVILIWVIPYFGISLVLYYENLKKIKNSNN